MSSADQATREVSRVTFRDARLEDYEAIRTLQARNGLGSKTKEQWEHIWTGNPVWQKLENWAVGFVAENASGEVVGYCANIPLSYYFEDRELLVNTSYGMAVDPAYRGHAVFLVKRVLNTKAADMSINASANPTASKIMDRLGPRIPAGDWDNSRFWITNYNGFTGSVCKTKGWPKALSYPGAAALWLKDRFGGVNSWSRRRSPDVQQLSGFDERFDTFWAELRKNYPQRFLANRSRAVLDWHFKYNFVQKKIWLLTIEDKSRILAYGIFCRRDNPEFDLTRVRLIDYQVLDNRVELVVPMLVWAFWRCQQEGIHMLEAFGFRGDKQAPIDALSPHLRRLPAWSFFFWSRNKALQEHLNREVVWDPSHFDGDASL